MSRAGSRGLRTSCAGLEWPSGSGTSYITARAIPPNGAGSQVRRSSIRLALRGRKLACGQANQCPSCCVQARASERQNRKSTAAVQARTLAWTPLPSARPSTHSACAVGVRASGGHHRRRLPSVSSSSDIGSMIRHAPRTRLDLLSGASPYCSAPSIGLAAFFETPYTVCCELGLRLLSSCFSHFLHCTRTRARLRYAAAPAPPPPRGASITPTEWPSGRAEDRACVQRHHRLRSARCASCWLTRACARAGAAPKVSHMKRRQNL